MRSRINYKGANSYAFPKRGLNYLPRTSTPRTVRNENLLLYASSPAQKPPTLEQLKRAIKKAQLIFNSEPLPRRTPKVGFRFKDPDYVAALIPKRKKYQKPVEIIPPGCDLIMLVSAQVFIDFIEGKISYGNFISGNVNFAETPNPALLYEWARRIEDHRPLQ